MLSLNSYAQRFNVRFEVDGVEKKITHEYKLCLVLYDSFTRVLVNYKRINSGELNFPEFVKNFEHCYILLLTPDYGIIGPHIIYPAYGDDRIKRFEIDTSREDKTYINEIIYRTFVFGVDKKPFHKSYISKKYKDNPNLIWRTQYVINNISYPEIVQIRHFHSIQEWKKNQKYLEGYFHDTGFTEVMPNYNRKEEDEE